MNAKGTISKKINVSFIVHFRLGKYSFSLNTLNPFFIDGKLTAIYMCWMPRELFGRKLMFIVHFCIGEYTFSLNTLSPFFWKNVCTPQKYNLYINNDIIYHYISIFKFYNKKNKILIS